VEAGWLADAVQAAGQLVKAVGRLADAAGQLVYAVGRLADAAGRQADAAGAAGRMADAAGAAGRLADAAGAAGRLADAAGAAGRLADAVEAAGRLVDAVEAAGRLVDAVEAAGLPKETTREPAAVALTAEHEMRHCLVLMAAARAKAPGAKWAPQGLLLCDWYGCTNVAGPSELQLVTQACGGCGDRRGAMRYCSRACQAAAWRAGHKLACPRGATPP
jgi:hypothetical protein